MRNRDYDGFMDYLYPDDREPWEDSEEAFNAYQARREDEAREEQALDDIRREDTDDD